MTHNSNIDAIFLGKHTNKAVEVCDTLYPENKDVCTCWVAKAKQAIQQELLKARIDELGLLDKTTKKHIYVESDGYLKDRIADLQAKLKGDDK